MEADFLREYGIDLMEQMESMTWRRFLCLTKNLSAQSAVAGRARTLHGMQPEEKEEKSRAAAFFAGMTAQRGEENGVAGG